MMVVRELPLLLNGVDKAFFIVGIIVIIISAFIGYNRKKYDIPFITSIVVFIFTMLYIFIFRNKESTIHNPWVIFLSEIVLGVFYSFAIGDWELDSIDAFTVVILLVFMFGVPGIYELVTQPVYVLEDNTTITAEEFNFNYNKNIVTCLEEKVEEIPIYAFSTGANVNGSMSVDGGPFSAVGSGYINTERVYIYYYENEWGILVQGYVTADPLYSGFSRTLKEGEQPYLKKIHQYDVTVDKNITPEVKLTEEYKRTLNIFYVPENAIVAEFSLD